MKLITAAFASLALACLFEHSLALKCTSLTAKTCAASMFMTGTCQETGVCACKTGSVPSKYGCQKSITPTVTAVTTDDKLACSGECIVGGSVELSCSPVITGATYNWYKNNKVLGSETSQTYAITGFLALTHEGKYTCTVTQSNVESAKSAEFPLTTVATVTTKPVVTGMPKKYFSGQKVNLACENLPSHATTTTYSLGTTSKVKAQVTLTSTDVTKTVDCGFKIGAAAAAVKSDPVPYPTLETPAEMADPIVTGVQRPVSGKPTTLSCNMNSDYAEPESGITYAWTKDKVSISDKTKTLKVTISEIAVYTCTLTYKTVDKTSAAFTVTPVVITNAVTATPSIPLLSGYVKIECKITGAPAGATITYAWKKDKTVLAGVTDNILQLNSLASGDQGGYACMPTVDGFKMSPSNAVFDSVPAALDISIKPTLTSSKKMAVNFEIGKSYTLMCTATDHKTPGVTYVWQKNGVDEAWTGPTLQILATKTTTKYSCQMAFSGGKTGKSDELSVQGKAIVSVEITYSDNTVVPSAITVPASKKLDLVCKPTLAAKQAAPTYQWDEDKSKLATTSKYTYTTKKATIRCAVTVGSEVQRTEITITISATIQPPTLTVSPVAVEYSRGATYNLVCATISRVNGLTYTFSKGATALGTASTSDKYTISNAVAANDGTYSCKATLATTSSVKSDDLVIAIKASGKYCTAATSSTACAGSPYKGTCTNKRCDCQSNYVLKGDKCGSGAATLVASFILMAVTFVSARLL